MQIIITKPNAWHFGKTFHAFFIGDKGAVCVPYEDGLDEYGPTDYAIKDVQAEIKTAKEMLRANSACTQLKRLNAYFEANDMPHGKAN